MDKTTKVVRHGMIPSTSGVLEVNLARQIASASAQTLAIGKPAFYRQIELPRPDAYDLAQKVMVDNLLKEDAHEGISAFLEKRSPQWNH